MTDRPEGSPAVVLADQLVDHRVETEHDWALWTGALTHLARWDDLSEDGIERRIATLREFEDRAAMIETNDPMDRLLLETVIYTATARIVELQWRDDLNWVNHATGIFPSIFTFLPRFALVSAEHGEQYLDKIRALPVFIDQWRARLDTATVAGRAPIVHLVDRMIDSIDGHLSSPLSTGPLGQQPSPREFGDEAAATWVGRLHALLDEDVAAAFGRLGTTLRDVVRPCARPDDEPGLLHVPGGAELYEQLVWAHTTLDISAAEVHDIGLRQIALLEDEYRELAAPLLGADDITEIYRRLRDDSALRYHDSATIVADATTALAKAAESMGDWFGRLPAAPCIAKSIEQGSLAFYSPPARDGSKPGTFFFNTADPTMWATYQLEAVTYHESIPGHHLQFSIAQEIDGLHPLLGSYYVTAYGEGWGLYTERLADEMGLYSSPLDRVGMLAADSMRACRLVVDTGMHALGWSRDRAIRYMLDHSPLSQQQVVNEIDRYIGNPGQAVSYMIGRLEIERIREEAQARLGDAFDIRGFHDVVLGSGSITLASLRRIVEAWSPIA
ncbi:MAG: DUF885 domain-containing protein [Ilumatobacteraceae bacterium]